ncbi:MAG: hypothetical protein ACREAK_05620 [Nitrosarchaeum sp.]
MKPIILLGIMAAIGIFAGSGFLAPVINNVLLQNIGVGDKDLETPIDSAGVDLQIQAFLDPVNQVFKNKFVSCSFHSGESPLEGSLDKVICKLTDENDNAIAEASLQFCTQEQADADDCPLGTVQWEPSQQYILSPLIEAYPGALQLDNVEDVRLVVMGDDPTDDT